MNGLDKLVERIAGESREEISVIRAEAESSAASIRADGKRKAEEECAAIVRKADREVETIRERAKASAELKEKQILLGGRQDLIRSTIALAKDKLESMSDKDYAAFIDGLLKKNIPSKDAVLMFNEADLKRLPKKVVNDFTAAAAKNGATVTVSGKPADIKNGFILDFGGIEENCTFDALIDDNIEMLQDKVKAILFA